jgi:hypothetical protein
MADIPNTETVHVAVIAAALQISQASTPPTSTFQNRLKTFLIALSAIEKALQEPGGQFEVDPILESVFKK